MVVGQMWKKVQNWTKDVVGQKASKQNSDIDQPIAEESVSQAGQIAVQQPCQVQRKDNVEVLNEAFGNMVDQLKGINEHLGKQVTQNEELMDRMEKLPELLESLPSVVGDQKQMVESLVEQFKDKTLKEKQFLEAIESIPNETAKQSNRLSEISQKLSVSAEADVQLSENFNRFSDTLSQLDRGTSEQTSSISQMKETFQSSEKHLQEILASQEKRFMWVFITAVSVSLIAIAGLVTGIILVIRQ